jgi:hypothetical protein
MTLTCKRTDMFPVQGDFFKGQPALPTCEHGLNTKDVVLSTSNFYTLAAGESHCPDRDMIRSPAICARAVRELGLQKMGEGRSNWTGTSSAIQKHCSFALDAIGGQDTSKFGQQGLDFSKPTGLHFNFGSTKSARRRLKRRVYEETQFHLHASAQKSDLCPVCITATGRAETKECTFPSVSNGVFTPYASSMIPHGSIIDETLGQISCNAGFHRSMRTDFECRCPSQGAPCQQLHEACESLRDFWKDECPKEYANCNNNEECNSELDTPPPINSEGSRNFQHSEAVALDACITADYMWKMDDFPPCISACGHRPNVTRQVLGCEMLFQNGSSLLVSTSRCESEGLLPPQTTLKCPSLPQNTPCDDGFEETTNDVCLSPDKFTCAGACLPGFTDDQQYSVQWQSTMTRWRISFEGIFADTDGHTMLKGGSVGVITELSLQKILSKVLLDIQGEGEIEGYFALQTVNFWYSAGATRHHEKLGRIEGLRAGKEIPSVKPADDSFHAFEGTIQVVGNADQLAVYRIWTDQSNQTSSNSSSVHGMWFEFEDDASSYFDRMRFPARFYDEYGDVVQEKGALKDEQWKEVDRWRRPCVPCKPGFYKNTTGGGLCRSCPIGRDC